MIPFPRPVLISGAGVGIGRFCAELLAERGARLFLIDRDVNRCQGVAVATGGHPVIGDLAEQGTIERAVNAATLAGGGLSVMIHSISLSDGVDFDAIRAHEIGAEFETHVASLLTLSAASLRAMALERNGLLLRIIVEHDQSPASVRVLQAAQDAAWSEVGRVAALQNVRVETLTATPDELPADVGKRVVEFIDTVFAADADPADTETP